MENGNYAAIGLRSVLRSKFKIGETLCTGQFSVWKTFETCPNQSEISSSRAAQANDLSSQ